MPDQLSSDLAQLKIDRSAPSPRRNALRTALILIVIAATGAAAYGFMKRKVEAALVVREISATEILLVSPSQAQIELTASGYVVPQVISRIAAKVPGRLAKVYVKQGDTVSEGALLFEIDTNDQDAAIAVADSQVASAKARVAVARANHAEAVQLLERRRALEAEKIGARSDVEDSVARVSVLAQLIKVAETDLKVSQANAAAQRVNLKNFVVRSPLRGTVTNKPPQAGEFIGPQPAGIAADMGGVEITEFSSLMVEVDIPESRLHQVKKGTPSEIVLDAFPNKRYRGRLWEVTPKVNRAKATVIVKVEFLDEKDGVLPEMSARVSFLSAELDKAAINVPPKVVVPGSALLDRAGSKAVYVIDGGKVRLTPVTVGEPIGSGFVLVNGPPPGTRIVQTPSANLVDGQTVQEKNEG